MLSREQAAGFTLVELLVSLFLTGIVLVLMSGVFSGSSHARRQMNLRTEVQQGLRSLAEMVTGELRQAGACLPPVGQFISLEGTDGGDQDGLLLRIGRTHGSTLVCVQAAADAPTRAGGATFQVDSTSGFETGGLVYVTPNGATGDFYTVAGLTDTTLTVDRPVVADHPVGTGIYAVDERVYEIDTASYGRPVLTVSIDGGSAQPFVDGVEAFDVAYVLDPCPPCDTVGLPVDATEWRLVREIAIEAAVRSRTVGDDGEYVHESGEFRVKPRNLL